MKPAKNLMRIALSLVALGIFLSSCQKKEIPGPKGEPGTPGGGGNSNIVASSIFAIASSQWNANSDSTVWQFKIDAPQVTGDIAEKGAVKVFTQVSGVWWEMPYLAGEFLLQFGFSINTITLSYFDPHGQKLQRPATANFRFITLSEIAKAAHPYPEKNSYELYMALAINSN